MPTLQFKGKTFVQNHHLAVKYHQLVPQKKLSLTDKVSLHDNLIIQGDNLKALKALLPTYGGKVKCIYIDPPYNTGNENWVYNDNVNSPMINEWLGKVVDKEDLTRHDKWLCMMMPRLKLLRELLSEDGVIFISIDDNEQHALRLLLDEVFESENFVANIIWQKKYSISNDDDGIAPMHDFILAYSKSSSFVRNFLPRTEESNKRYTNTDNDPRGPWASAEYVSSKSKEERPTLWYPIIHPKTKKQVWPNASAVWRYSKEKHETIAKENRLYWGPTQEYKLPRLKRFLSEIQNGLVPNTWWTFEQVGHNDEAKKEVSEIFEDKKAFPTPKPIRLLKRILQLATDEESIILDSFSGSGTTAHAVLELNKEDGGNRKFILIEQEDYADKITAERVRRVVKGVKSAKDELLKKGLGGTFSYFQLGDAIEMESLLTGKKLPTYKEFARYLFYTATGEEFDAKAIDETKNYIGESKNYQVYLFYKPDLEWLKANALTLEQVKALPKHKGKKRLVFASTKYVDDYSLSENRVEFSQLPYEIYRLQK
jgi:adenine-specific DNA-methyltransferase